MEILTFDLIIVVLYLVFTLAIGIYKGLNIKSVKEYAIGDYKFSDSVLIATITATWIGAGTLLGLHENIYQYGIVWLAIFMAAVLEMVIFYNVAPGLIKFKGLVSIAEILGKWYGPNARIIGGICVALYSIGMVGTQIAGIGYLFDAFLGINPLVGIIISAGIVVVYSSFGGIKSVTYTDVIQFAFFVVAIPLIASVMISEVGGIKGLISKLPSEHLKLFPSYGNKTQYIVLFLFYCIPFCDPCLIQRVLMSKDRAQLHNSFRATAIVMSVFYVVCALIALSALVLDATMDPNKVLYNVINDYLPIGVKGLGIAGVLAVIMSTADSYLNVASVAVVNDVINPIYSGKKLKPKQELFIMQLTTTFIGICAIYFAGTSKSVITLMINSSIVWAPIMVVPTYSAMLGFKSNFKTFASAGFMGCLTVILWNIFNLEEATSVGSYMPALGINLITFTLCTWYYTKYAPQQLNNKIKKYTIAEA